MNNEMRELIERLRRLLNDFLNWAMDFVRWAWEHSAELFAGLMRVIGGIVGWILDLIRKLLEARKQRATRIEFWSEGQQIGGPGMANETQLHNNKKKNIELLFKDDAGVERPVDGRPDIKGPVPEGICDIQIAPDGMSFMLFGKNPNSESPGIVGDVVVTVTADVDKGEGFKPLTEELTVHVVEPEAPQATDIEFKAGDEEDL